MDSTDPDYQQAKDNAEFYRNQLELLREEVDDQNTRTSQHYEEKVRVLLFVRNMHKNSVKPAVASYLGRA